MLQSLQTQRILKAYQDVTLNILFPKDNIKIISIFVLYNNIYFTMVWLNNSINFFLIDDNNIIHFPILKVTNKNGFFFKIIN